MPSTRLTSTLTGLGESGAVLSKGTVAAVSPGLLTVTISGTDYPRVPYLDTGWVPEVGDQVYLLNQENFGMLALGGPASTTPPPVPPTPTVVTVDPTTVANWQMPPATGMVQAEDGSWVPNNFYATGKWVDLTGRLIQTPPSLSAGVWFYPQGELAAIDFDIASCTMQIEMVSGGPLELVLHSFSGPSGTWIPTVPSILGDTRIVNAPPVGVVTEVPIPLGWAYQLVGGAAKGIAMYSRTNTAEVFAHGSLTFTSL